MFSAIFRRKLSYCQTPDGVHYHMLGGWSKIMSNGVESKLIRCKIRTIKHQAFDYANRV